MHVCPVPVRREDVVSVGGKGANLGELIAAGFRVPDGFVVTAYPYLDAVTASGVRSGGPHSPAKRPTRHSTG